MAPAPASTPALAPCTSHVFPSTNTASRPQATRRGRSAGKQSARQGEVGDRKAMLRHATNTGCLHTHTHSCTCTRNRTVAAKHQTRKLRTGWFLTPSPLRLCVLLPARPRTNHRPRHVSADFSHGTPTSAALSHHGLAHLAMARGEGSLGIGMARQVYGNCLVHPRINRRTPVSPTKSSDCHLGIAWL